MGCQQAFEAQDPRPPHFPETKRKPRGFLTTLLSQLDEIDSDFKAAVVAGHFRQEYTDLLKFLGRPERVEGVLAYPKWAACPETLGTLATAVLNRFSSRPDFTLAEEVLLRHVEALLSGLQTDSSCSKHHSAFLLYKLSSLGFAQFNQALLTCGIYSLLEPCLGDRGQSFRFLILKLCCSLYKDNPEAKAEFCRVIGMQVLVSQALFGLRQGIQIKARFEWLLVLIKDEKGYLNEEYAEQLIERFKVCSLRRLRLPPLNAEESKVFKELFSLLNNRELSTLTEADSQG